MGETWLRNHIPDLYKECGQRYLRFRRSCFLIRRVVRAESIQKAIACLVAEGINPTPNVLSARYGFYFRDPLVLRLVTRYREKGLTALASLTLPL